MIFEIKCASCDSQIGYQNHKKWSKTLTPVTYTVCPACQKIISPEGAQKIVDSHILETLAMQASASNPH
jgi:hypothetical protein